MKNKDLGYEERGEGMAPRDMIVLNQKQREKKCLKNPIPIRQPMSLHSKH